MSQRIMRFVPVLLTALAMAGCTSSDPSKALKVDQPAVDQTLQAQVVQGTCPNITLREGTAYHTSYARGGEGDPTKVINQFAIDNTTRQCRIDGDQMVMTVVAAGRVVTGPEGKPGQVEVPIRVAVVEGDKVLYSDLRKQPVTVGPSLAAEQFLFTNAQVTFPASAASAVKVFVGIDPGPTKKRK